MHQRESEVAHPLTDQRFFTIMGAGFIRHPEKVEYSHKQFEEAYFEFVRSCYSFFFTELNAARRLEEYIRIFAYYERLCKVEAGLSTLTEASMLYKEAAATLWHVIEYFRSDKGLSKTYLGSLNSTSIKNEVTVDLSNKEGRAKGLGKNYPVILSVAYERFVTSYKFIKRQLGSSLKKEKMRFATPNPDSETTESVAVREFEVDLQDNYLLAILELENLIFQMKGYFNWDELYPQDLPPSYFTLISYCEEKIMQARHMIAVIRVLGDVKRGSLRLTALGADHEQAATLFI